MRSQTLGILLLILCATVDPVNACTTFIYSDGEVTLGGNNEDHSNPLPMILFIPAEDGKYGRVYIGFENYRGRAEAPILQVQAGVNDHGLFFDSLAAPTVEVAPEGDKPCYMGNMMLRAMEECATVEEVLEIFDRYDHPGIVNDQLFIGDSTGDAVIIEPHTVVRKTGDFMIATNFLQSRTNPEDIDSPEYLTTEDMLGSASNVTVELFRDILEAVKSENPDGSGTLYSYIFDLKNGIIYLYHFRDFSNPMTFFMADEFEKGEHAYDLPSLAPESEDYERWARPKIDELGRKIEARLASDFDPSILDDYVGHYKIQSELGYIPLPPQVYMDSINITRFGDIIYLKPSPQGAWIGLNPESEDSFFHLNGMPYDTPEFDVTFIRNESGAVVQAQAEFGGIGTFFFNRVGAGLNPSVRAEATQSWLLYGGIAIALISTLALYQLKRR